MSDNSAITVNDEIRQERLVALQGLIEMMRPAVQADGGDLVLVNANVDSGVIEVQLQGACSSCAISSSTLEGGVERILKGRLDWVTEVVGGVDDIDPEAVVPMGVGGWTPRSDL
jgi:Fe-S cluster biogenesis protein NfuA